MLEPHEKAAAALQGWQLVEVFDTRTRLLRPEILPLNFDGVFRNARAALGAVVYRAREGEIVAIKAVRFVMQGLKK